MVEFSDVYFEHSRTSTMETLPKSLKIVHYFRKKANIDVQPGFKYSSEILFYFKGTLTNADLKISLHISVHIKIIP